MSSKWEKVQPGQTRDEVVDIMGEPVGFSSDEGKYVYFWKIDNFASCGIRLNNDGKVEDKRCKDNSEGRARAQAMFMQNYMQNQQQRQPSYTPIQPYQAPRTTQTNCTSKMVMGQLQTDCSSAPSGIDTSIYH